MIETWEGKQGYLEKFGVYYLNLFSRLDTQRNVFDLSDEQLTDRVNWITNKGIITSSLVGMVCVFPTVWVDVHFAGDSFVKHYGWVAVVTLVSVVLELYVLFLISLKAVHEVSELINLHARKNELLNDRIFGVKNILARAALELPDPKLKILGIDPRSTHKMKLHCGCIGGSASSRQAIFAKLDSNSAAGWISSSCNGKSPSRGACGVTAGRRRAPR